MVKKPSNLFVGCAMHVFNNCYWLKNSSQQSMNFTGKHRSHESHQRKKMERCFGKLYQLPPACISYDVIEMLMVDSPCERAVNVVNIYMW